MAIGYRAPEEAATPGRGSQISLALFSPLYPPFRGGAATDADLLAPYLSEVVSLFLVTERAPGYPRVEKRQGNGGRKFTVLRILPRYSSVETSGLNKALLLLLNRLVLLGAIVAMRVRYGVRLIHFHGQYARFGMAYLLSFLAHVLQMRTIIDIRDKGVKGRIIRSFDMAIGASLSVADNVRSDVLPHKFSLVSIPHVARLSKTNGTHELPERFFLFVGTVRRLKGVDVLIQAYRQYKDEIGGTTSLVLIGPILDVGLVQDAGVLAIGPRDPEIVFEAMRRCQLLLLPSRSEGLPHVCLEAIEAGARFVVGPGIPEIEKFCPSNVLPNITPETIVECLKNPQAVPAAKGYDLAQHRPEEIAKTLLAIYNKVLSS